MARRLAMLKTFIVVYARIAHRQTQDHPLALLSTLPLKLEAPSYTQHSL